MRPQRNRLASLVSLVLLGIFALVGRVWSNEVAADSATLTDVLAKLDGMRSEQQSVVEELRLQHAKDLETMRDSHEKAMKELRDSLTSQKSQIQNLAKQASGASALPNQDRQLAEVTPTDAAEEPLAFGRQLLEGSKITTDTDFDTFSTLSIKSDKSQVIFGSSSDVRLVRTGESTLEILVDELFIHGALHVDSLFVNGTDVGSALSTKTNVTVEVLTGSAASSDSTDTIYVEFYSNAKGWSEPMEFFDGTSIGSIHKKSFMVDTEPSRLRFSLSGDDAWGFAQVAVWINDSDEIIIVCTDIMGTQPSMGDNGHWIDGDGGGGAPTSVAHDISPMCSSQVTITVETGSVTSSDTSNTVYVTFYVDGAWQDALPLFTGSSIGDIETETYGLSAAPTQLEFSISGSNAWGFDYLAVKVDGYTKVLSCDNTQTGMSSSSVHWYVSLTGCSCWTPCRFLFCS